MAKLSTGNLLDAFKEMTLLELSDFVKEFETVFDVKATAPAVSVPADDTNDGTASVEADEQDEFDVILESAGDKKIPVVKIVREVISGLGLKEAKDLVESAPTAILEKVTKEAAESAKGKFEAVGATITFK